MLRRTHWNRAKAARVLGISYKALLYKIVDCGLVNKGDGAAEESRMPGTLAPGELDAVPA
jgi:hypothetical protein